MNVLQAIDKLGTLKDKVKVLELAIEKLKEDQKSYENVSSYEIQILTEISDEYELQVQQLEHQLEITPLVTTRGTN